MEHLPITNLPLNQIQEPALKLLISHTPHELDAIQTAVMREPYIDQFSVFRTCDWYLEFVAAGRQQRHRAKRCPYALRKC